MTRADLAATTDPGVFDINRSPGRSVPAGRSALEPGDPDAQLDLCGEWQFEWVFDLRDFDPAAAGVRGAAGDDRVAVPGVWQLAGYGVPYYLANTYPPMLGKRRIPDIDQARNEAGVYSRTFEVPESWQGRRINVVFEGVRAGMFLFVNEEFVGYTQGSFLPAEFDLTRYVRPGGNRMTAVVVRFTDGSYLEDQDMWFFSGIFRPVWLHAEPATAIHDLWVKPGLAAPYVDGTLTVDVSVRAHDDPPGAMQVDIMLRRPGQQDWEQVASEPVVATGADTRVVSVIEVPGALTWTAETPHLYEVAAVLRQDGSITHVKSVRTGIRSIEIADEQLLVNGRPVTLKGVNRHDFDPDFGWAVPQRRYRHDLTKAKQLNINAIRCSHYPNPQLLYDMADELGLYVMDECDLETHGIRRKNVPGDNPVWTGAVVDRMERMVLADRNHPSIIMWSLGNEAGLGGADGGNFVRMKQAAMAIDDSRPFHYEGDHNPAISDVVSRMYATAEQMAVLGRKEELKPGAAALVTNRFLTDDKLLTPDILAGRPVLLCEYAHAMENSLGNFAEYIDVFYRYPSIAGGFIWDYVDQSIHRVTDSGEEQWLYGGDFGESPSHRYFCANGILAADRSEHPSAREVFWGYRNLVVDAVSPTRGMYRLTNRFSFTDAAEFAPEVEVLVDGAVVRTVQLPPVHVDPGESAPWSVPESVVEPAAAGTGEIVVRFTFRTRAETAWAPAGHVIAFDEFLVRRAGPDAWRLGTGAGLTVPEHGVRDGRLLVSAGDAEFSVDLSTGHIDSWRRSDTEILQAPLRPNYWRALTDNDRGFANFDRRLGFLVDTAWRDPNVGVARFEVVPGTGALRAVFLLKSRVFRNGILRYDFAADGSVVCHHSLVPRKDMIRLGFTMQLAEVDHVQWYGKGPHETYIDRLHGGRTDTYDLPLPELRHDYMRPQENGNRTQVRWLAARGPWGGVRAEDVTGDWLGFTAWPYTQEALDAAEHIHELALTEDRVTLNIDRQQRGVGGDTPGVAALLPAYRMPAGEPQSVTLRLRPL